MFNLMPYLIALHLLSAVVWVGGMFFAWMILRPVAAEKLEPPARLPLWTGCFDRFFPWVWASVVLLPLTGYLMVFGVFGGMDRAGTRGLLMQAIGIPMLLIFMHLYFAPYRRLRRAVKAEDWPAAGQQLATIRRMVGINLILGLVLAVAGSAGRY